MLERLGIQEPNVRIRFQKGSYINVGSSSLLWLNPIYATVCVCANVCVYVCERVCMYVYAYVWMCARSSVSVFWP